MKWHSNVINDEPIRKCSLRTFRTFSPNDVDEATQESFFLGISTGRWKQDEHQRFLEGLLKYKNRSWRRIAAVVGTRNHEQVRTHAQKFFMKIKKNQNFGGNSGTINYSQTKQEQEIKKTEKISNTHCWKSPTSDEVFAIQVMRSFNSALNIPRHKLESTTSLRLLSSECFCTTTSQKESPSKHILPPMWQVIGIWEDNEKERAFRFQLQR